MRKGKMTFIMQAMRRASYKWPPRFNTLKKAHIGRNQYLCASCGGVFKKKEINMDHIEPVMPLEGTEDLNILLDRMLADEDGWQCLCKPCHKIKTDKENETRRELKEPPKKKSRKKKDE